MRIEVKLYGDLKRYAPGGQTQFRPMLQAGATLEALLKQLSIPDGRHVALINGRRATQATRFKDGDTLVLIPPISGG